MYLLIVKQWSSLSSQMLLDVKSTLSGLFIHSFIQLKQILRITFNTCRDTSFEYVILGLSLLWHHVLGFFLWTSFTQFGVRIPVCQQISLSHLRLLSVAYLEFTRNPPNVFFMPRCFLFFPSHPVLCWITWIFPSISLPFPVPLLFASPVTPGPLAPATLSVHPAAQKPRWTCVCEVLCKRQSSLLGSYFPKTLPELVHF